MKLREAMGADSRSEWQVQLEELDEAVWELVNDAELDAQSRGPASSKSQSTAVYKAKLAQLRMAIEEALDDVAQSAEDNAYGSHRR